MENLSQLGDFGVVIKDTAVAVTKLGMLWNLYDKVT